MTTTESLMQAVLSAPAAARDAALLVLRGQAEVAARGMPGTRGQVEPYVGLKDVAAFLGVSARSVWRWGVPGHKFGSRTRFRLSEVAAYTESEAFRRRTEELKRTRNAPASAGEDAGLRRGDRANVVGGAGSGGRGRTGK